MASFDVIVIGSGPAGCSAAVVCAQAGLRVIIITEEKETSRTHETAPGILESIHPGVSSLLAKIGASGAEVKAARAYYEGIYSRGNYKPLGEDESGVWQGMHINREVFNRHLVQHVRDGHIPVKFDERVESFILEENKIVGIKTKTTALNANFVIDATGYKAVAGKKLNFKRKFFSPPLVCWTGISGEIEAFPFDPNAAHFIAGSNGWTWLAPQPPNHCAWTRLSAKGVKTFLPPVELSAYPVIGRIQVGNMRWRMFRPVCSEGIVLCGDAAGILDPAAGQGIFNALLSGMMAANTVISCISQPDLANFHLAKYDDWFAGQFESKVKQLKLYYREHDIDIVG